MSTVNRFALLGLDEDNDGDKKSSKATSKKSGIPNKTQNAAKKNARRKKTGAATKAQAASVELSEDEVAKRIDATQDRIFEDSMNEAIIASKISFEEEHARQVETEFEVSRGGKGRKKKPLTEPVGTKTRHGVTMSLAEFQASKYSNGAFVKQVTNREPSPPALPTRTATSHPMNDEDFFANTRSEAKRLLEAEKRHEDLQKIIQNRQFDLKAHGDTAEEEEKEREDEEEDDPSSWRLKFREKEAELAALSEKFEMLQQERNELHRYFQITENKTAAHLAQEVEKLRKLNGELNNNLVETCIELEKHRSRVHELEKNLPNRAGRTQRNSENEW